MRKKYFSNTKAFTLIELLVVIAIIALLLAIIMPALKTAKAIARGVICMSNARQLSICRSLYTEDSGGKLPDASPSGGANSYSFVQPPQEVDGTVIAPMENATFEDRIRGIQAGTLYPYVEDHKLYHCMADRRFVGEHHNYLSYAMPASLGDFTKKMTEIKRPFEKYLFVEESDTRPYMVGGWSLGVPESGGRDGWWDGLAVWHNKSSMFGFGDGHAGKHKWVNEGTLERSNRDLTGGGGYGYEAWTPGTPREDLNWLQAHWPSRK